MAGKKALGGLAIVGFVLWKIATALRPRQDAVTEPAPAPLPPAPPEELPAAAHSPAAHIGFGRRLATSSAFAVLFFAGAALAAGAGNEFVSVDAGSTEPALVLEAATDTTATTTEETTTTTETPTTDVAATTEEIAPATPDAEPVAVEPAVVESAAAEPVAVAADPADATPTPRHVAAEPAAAAATTTPTPARKVRVVARPHATKRIAAPPAVVVQSPFPVISFDPQAWLAAHPGSPRGNAVVAIAKRYLGVPYVWGGNTPTGGFDCSGLTQFVYAQLGVWLPHYAAAQFLAYSHLDPSELQPGDLVFFEPKADGPGHVAIYAGNGEIVEAPHTGALVRVGSLAGSAASLGFLGAVRPTQLQQTFTLATVGPPMPSRSIAGRFIAD